MSEPDTSSDMTAVMAALASGDLSELVRALKEERDAAFAALDLMPFDDDDLEPWPEEPPDEKPVLLRLTPDHTAIRSTRCRSRDCRRHRTCRLPPPARCGNPRKPKLRSAAQASGAADNLLRRVQAMQKQMFEKQKAKEAAREAKRKKRYWER